MGIKQKIGYELIAFGSKNEGGSFTLSGEKEKKKGKAERERESISIFVLCANIIENF